MSKIVFLYEFPEAVKPCLDYIAKTWELPINEARDIVNQCLSDNKGLPFILVAEERKVPIGWIFASNDNADVSTKYKPWLLALYVKEEFRNRGLGRSLVERACEELKKCGYDKVYIDTVGTEGFYRKLGWTFVEKVPWKDEVTSIFSYKLKPRK